MSPVGAIFVPFPPKTRTTLLDLRPPSIVELVKSQYKIKGASRLVTTEHTLAQVVSSRTTKFRSQGCTIFNGS